MERYFIDKFIPYPEKEFIQDMYRLFQRKTGESIKSTTDALYVREYSHGGMSSGGISPKFWLNEAIPLLIGRLSILNVKWRS